MQCNAPLPIQQKTHPARKPARDLASPRTPAEPIRRILFSRAPLQPGLRAKELERRRRSAAQVASEVGPCGAIENKEFSKASPEPMHEAFTSEQHAGPKRRAA